MLSLISTPDRAEPVQLQEVEEPQPGPDEALIEVRAYSINRGELSLLAQRPGWRPGQDVAGVVVEAAAGGRGPAQGARVVAAVDGAGWAQRVAASVNRMAVLADGVDFAQAATLPVAGLTALRALREVGTLLGRRVLVDGAAGGVGQFAVQLAAMAGARVTAAAGTPQRAARLLQLGAIRATTYDGDLGGPFDAVLESVGGAVLEAALSSVAPGGLVVLYGRASNQPARLGLGSFQGHGVRVQSFFIYQTGVATFGEDLDYLVGLVAAGRLRPPVGMTASWRNAADAIAALRERRVEGKVALLVD